MESLTRLREQRAFLCRLSPDRALGSVEEADTFLQERGLLTRTADCALPSLYEACHEDPYQPGRPGFATSQATKWPWFGALADRGHLITAVHRGKSLLIAAAVRAAVLAPETELRRWFSWQWYWADSLVDDLIGRGRLRRIDGHVTSASQPATVTIAAPRGIPESCLKSAQCLPTATKNPPIWALAFSPAWSPGSRQNRVICAFMRMAATVG